ncbi:Uncharacterised protein [Mycobacteroides abscessus subsp. abscessus]|nr:Uncharacterised protein [Mycobacteroides abscessus subsp. abscessus]
MNGRITKAVQRNGNQPIHWGVKATVHRTVVPEGAGTSTHRSANEVRNSGIDNPVPTATSSRAGL